MSAACTTSTKSGPGETRQHCCTAASFTARCSKASRCSAPCRSRVISTRRSGPSPSAAGDSSATRRSITPASTSRAHGAGRGRRGVGACGQVLVGQRRVGPMCGIVGAVSTRNIVPILIEGLQAAGVPRLRLLRRGRAPGGELRRARSTSRVAELEAHVARDDGIEAAPASPTPAGPRTARRRCTTRTRTSQPARAWTPTHRLRQPGGVDGGARIGLVHNGIIENHDELRAELQAAATCSPARPTPRSSPTWCTTCTTATCSTPCSAPCRAARAPTPSPCSAATSRTAWSARARARRWCWAWARGENFLASDAMALAGVTDQIVYLEEGDVVDLQLGKVLDQRARRRGPLPPVERPVRTVHAHSGAAELGPYRHYMQKEIFEQPRAIADTLDRRGRHQPRAVRRRRLPHLQGHRPRADPGLRHQLLQRQHRALLAGEHRRHPDQVEIASEYRYRDSVPDPRTLVVTISQSGETADTMAALKHARGLGMPHTLTICNVATSAMVRECALAYITRAGVEIGVASTKAFTTQLVACSC
jgi:glucosamine--fructose-6-phosphate aminotransferase (isomerizing)